MKKKTPPTTPAPAKNVTVRFNVESIRLRLGYTKKKMAEMIGVSQTAYSVLCNNPTQVRLTTIQGILNLGAQVSEIFDIK